VNNDNLFHTAHFPINTNPKTGQSYRVRIEQETQCIFLGIFNEDGNVLEIGTTHKVEELGKYTFIQLHTSEEDPEGLYIFVTSRDRTHIYAADLEAKILKHLGTTKEPQEYDEEQTAKSFTLNTQSHLLFFEHAKGISQKSADEKILNLGKTILKRFEEVEDEEVALENLKKELKERSYKLNLFPKGLHESWITLLDTVISMTDESHPKSKKFLEEAQYLRRCILHSGVIYSPHEIIDILLEEIQ